MRTSVILLFLVITILGCSKNKARSKFAGTWSGSYSSTMFITNPVGVDTGTVRITVDANDKATGTLQSLHGGPSSIMNGKVDPSSGAISISKFGENNGITVFLVGLSGTLSLDSASGTLFFPWASTSGWRATKN